jgi:hypothetical protein
MLAPHLLFLKADKPASGSAAAPTSAPAVGPAVVPAVVKFTKVSGEVASVQIEGSNALVELFIPPVDTVSLNFEADQLGSLATIHKRQTIIAFCQGVRPKYKHCKFEDGNP